MQTKNAIEQNNKSASKKRCATNKAGVKDDTYLNNPKWITRIGEHVLQKLATKQPDHKNHVGMKSDSLPLITEPLLPEIIAISGSYTIRSSGLRLENTTNDPPVIHYNQVTNNVYGWGKGDHNICLGSL